MNTGQVFPRLIPLTCGHLTLPLAFFLDGETGDITVPVTAYLIDHPDGLTLFDTGLGQRFLRPPGAQARPAELDGSSVIDARLRAIDVDPAAIDRIVNSHLHTDHAGGNSLIPNAVIVVQDAEWDDAHAVDDRGYHPPEFDTGQPVIRVHGEHDLYGDGSVVLFATPGHTRGHQSARVRTAAGDVVLAGDACSLQRSLDEMRLPDHSHDRGDYLRSLRTFARLRAAGATICYSHDPEFWATVRTGVAWGSTQ
jgi:glyoxylase-like metal-dependent hydrolase (beta-lactamase superfamily II)